MKMQISLIQIIFKKKKKSHKFVSIKKYLNREILLVCCVVGGCAAFVSPKKLPVLNLTVR